MAPPQWPFLEINLTLFFTWLFTFLFLQISNLKSIDGVAEVWGVFEFWIFLSLHHGTGVGQTSRYSLIFLRKLDGIMGLFSFFNFFLIYDWIDKDESIYIHICVISKVGSKPIACICMSDCKWFEGIIFWSAGKDWRRRQIRKTTDKVFDHIKNQSGRATLSFEDLYIAVLLVYKWLTINFYLFIYFVI